MNAELELLNRVAAPVLVLTPDDHGEPRYAFVNEEAIRRAWVEPSHVMGKTALELDPGRAGRAAYEAHCRALRAKTAANYRSSLEIGGQTQAIDVHLEPLLDAEGRVTKIIGTLSAPGDIPDTEKLAAAASALDQEMQEFIGLAAHDLRGPMRRVQAIADMLQDDFRDLGDGKLRLIELLQTVAARSTTLINDVLSHMQATQATELIEEFSLAALCNEIVEMLDPAREHQLTLHDTRIYGDRFATQIVLRNLIENAITYNNGKQVRMDISAKAASSGLYQVMVRDQGSGFSQSALNFLREGKLRSDSGFGLAGARKLIMSRGGQMLVSNNADEPDAMVTFSLPGRIVT